LGLERPTILQIIPQLDAGGAERTTVEIAEAVVMAGGRALVLAEAGGRLAADIARAGGEVVPFPAATKNPVRLLTNARAIRRMIAAERVDLVHARSRAPAWSALWAARGAGVPFVTTYHGAYKEAGAAKRFYNGVMARGDVVIANSRYTARLIAERYGTPAARVEAIPRGVDLRRFDPEAIAAERVAALRAGWGIAPDQPVILLAARLTAWKGQPVLIEAAGRLKAAGKLKSAVVILAGDAQGRHDYVSTLREQIASRGLGDSVRIVGHVEDIPAAFLAAQVTVVASTDPEAFGRTAVEAAALGCPVIATDIGAPPETVLAAPKVPADASTGWLVPPGDAGVLAECLAQALDLRPATRSELGRRARRHVLANFTAEAMQRRTLAVYDRLLDTVLERRFEGSLAHRNRTSDPGKP
jgi:glycosyltransferase involved in cell wall biosynthesis